MFKVYSYVSFDKYPNIYHSTQDVKYFHNLYNFPDSPFQSVRPLPRASPSQSLLCSSPYSQPQASSCRGLPTATSHRLTG